MNAERREHVAIASSGDVVLVRQLVRRCCEELGFSLTDQTKMVTAASEIVRNALDYGGGGDADVEVLQNATRRGVRLIVEDHGPGIADIELALRDGYTTGNGLGLGMGGARRLVHEFQIASTPGKGTRVELTRWR
jgi:serine/threonine-protein kinase RsbT